MKEEAKEHIKQINIKVGNNLLKTRLAAGFSRPQLAKRIYLNPHQISKYESGINAITIGRLLLIAEALEVELFSLLDGINDDKPINKVKGGRGLCRKIARDIMKVKSRDQQLIILKIIRDIVDAQDLPKE